MTDFIIPESDEDLLDECEVETFRSSGPGGQNVNRRETAVRLRHRPTGIVVVCQKERSQYRNKLIALQQLRERLESLSKPVPVRIPTDVTRGAKRRNRTEKRQRALKNSFERNRMSIDNIRACGTSRPFNRRYSSKICTPKNALGSILQTSNSGYTSDLNEL